MFLGGCGTATSPAKDPNKPLRINAIYIFPTDARYPKDLWSAGVQGDVELRVKLGADGVPIDVALESSSRSRELDQLAMSMGRNLKYKLKDPASATTVIVPFEFARDTLETLRQKSCLEFNLDVAYFKATFPEAKTRKMKAVNLMVGLYFTYGLSNIPKEKFSAYNSRLAEAAEKVIDACAKAPEAGYSRTFADLVKM